MVSYVGALTPGTSGPLEDHRRVLNGDTRGLVCHQLYLAAGDGQVAALDAGRTKRKKEGCHGAWNPVGVFVTSALSAILCCSGMQWAKPRPVLLELSPASPNISQG